MKVILKYKGKNTMRPFKYILLLDEWPSSRDSTPKKTEIENNNGDTQTTNPGHTNTGSDNQNLSQPDTTPIFGGFDLDGEESDTPIFGNFGLGDKL